MSKCKTILRGIALFAILFASLLTSAFAQPPAFLLPEAPEPQTRVVDKKFIAVMGFEFSAIAGDMTSTELCLGEGGFHETNPWFGPHPSVARLSTESMAIFAFESLSAYELKKPHDWIPFDRQVRRLWWVYPVANGLEHFRLTYHNMKLYGQAKR